MSHSSMDAPFGGQGTLGEHEFAKVHQRMIDLEQELVEFQESSKELEQALEEELQELETQRSALVAQVQAKDKSIETLNNTVIALNSEVNELSEEIIAKQKYYEQTINKLKQKLVSVEISNDDILSNDRVLEEKLKIANQFNNELLEKIALIENDLELEKQTNAQHKLTISNLTNMNKSTNNEAGTSSQSTGIFTNSRNSNVLIGKKSERECSYRESYVGESTVLDISEMLATEPSQPASQTRMPRSESLTMFQELRSKSGAIRQKVGEVNNSLALKSYSTAQVSKADTPAFTTELARPTAASPEGVSDSCESLPIPTEKLPSCTTSKSIPASNDTKVPEEIKKKGTVTSSEHSLHRSISRKNRMRNVVKKFLT